MTTPADHDKRCPAAWDTSVKCNCGAQAADEIALIAKTLESAGDHYEIPSLRINPGDRVAQASLVPAPRVTFTVVEQLSLTERGAGGFGSTGVA